MPAVAARGFHNGLRRPVASKPGAVPKSFATRRGECTQSLAIPSYNNLDNKMGRRRQWTKSGLLFH